MRGLGPCLLVPVLLAAMPAFAADLQVTDFSDTGYDPSPAGAELTYSITVENGAADTVTNAVMVIDLPAGATAGTLAPFCAADAGVPTRVVCNIGTLVGTLGPGGAPVVFPLGVHTGGMAPGIVTVSGAIGFGDAVPPATTPVGSLVDGDPFFGADTNKPNNRRQETTTLVDAGNLRLEKSASPDPVVGGAVVTYTLTVTNQGPSNATNFTVTDTLPAASSYIAGSFSGAGWTFNGGSMTATHAGTLAVGASTSFSFQARVEAGSGNIVNSAVATAIGTPDPDTDDNTAQVTTAVTPGADLTVGKTATPAPAISGQPITFTLLARNMGPSAAENVSLVDAMPAGFIITGGTQPAGWTCVDDPGATERTCTRAAPMPPGAAETITIEALVPANGPNSSGDVTNSATIASDTPDPNGTRCRWRRRW